MSDSLLPDSESTFSNHDQLTWPSPVISSQQDLLTYGPYTQNITAPSLTANDAESWWKTFEQSALPIDDAGQGLLAIEAHARQPLNQRVDSQSAWNSKQRRKSINKRPCGYCQSSKVKCTPIKSESEHPLCERCSKSGRDGCPPHIPRKNGKKLKTAARNIRESES